jgi:hypothetical protein
MFYFYQKKYISVEIVTGLPFFARIFTLVFSYTLTKGGAASSFLIFVASMKSKKKLYSKLFNLGNFLHLDGHFLQFKC